MNKKRTFITLKAGTRLFSLLLFLTASIFISCNNAGKENKEGETTDTTVKEGKEGPVVNAISTFRKFRINKADLDLVNYTKLVLNPGFDDIADPTAMTLFYFHARTGDIGAGANADDTMDGEAAPFNTAKIIIANNEIVFENYDWVNFDYMVLEPGRDATNPDNLIFNIKTYKNAAGPTQPGGEIPIGNPLGRISKPSPPAPPALYIK